MTYDALDRLTSVTREVGGVPVSTEVYAFNGLGALSVNAGVAMDHQRPRLDGGGLADSAVPASLGGQPVTLDVAGRITSLRGVSLAYSGRGYLIQATPPVPGITTHILVDAEMRRVLKASADGTAVARYAYEGMDRVATLDAFGGVVESTLFEGIDHPVRTKRGASTVYFELDLASNVRRLRAAGGADLGGYRFSAFGRELEDTASGMFGQAFRWKGRPRDVLGASLETYDMRARQWVPELGGFSSVDEYSMQDFKSALWGWPRQSPIRFSDPTGQGPLDFASCLLHGGGWSQCVQAERDRFSHGPLGDCTNSPEACFGGGGGSGGAGASPGGGGGGSGGSGSGPYRSPDTPDPDFSPCSGVFGLSRLTCCRNVCTGAPADAPPVCVPLPPKGSRERDCLQRCFANPH